jgi:hypothetical protein
MIKKLILIITILTSISSCALWPYKKDFDCPVKEGLKCKSLYEISEMADQGIFAPKDTKPNDNQSTTQKPKCSSKRGGNRC